MARRWKEVSAEEKVAYDDMAKVDKMRYQNEQKQIDAEHGVPEASNSVPTSSHSVEQANRSSLEAAEAELDFEIARCAAEVEAEAAAAAELKSTPSQAATATAVVVVERAAEALEAADWAKAAPPLAAASLPGQLPCAKAASTTGAPAELTSRGHEVMHDWTQLLNHANEALLNETWRLPPNELFQRILLQINQSKRGMFEDKYNECKHPACPLQTRSAFIHVLKRVAESFMSFLRTMLSDSVAIESAAQAGAQAAQVFFSAQRPQQTAVAAVAAAAPAANAIARAAVMRSSAEAHLQAVTAEADGPCASTHIPIRGDDAVVTNATPFPVPALAPISAPTLAPTPVPTPAPKPDPARMAAPLTMVKAAPVAGTREAIEPGDLPTAATGVAATAATLAAASEQPTNVPRSSQQPQSAKGREKQPLARSLPATRRSNSVCWLDGAVEGRRLRIYWAGNGEFFEGTIKASPPWQEKQWDWVACDRPPFKPEAHQFADRLIPCSPRALADDDGEMKQHNLVRTHPTHTPKPHAT